jgi:hypothetical protein
MWRNELNLWYFILPAISLKKNLAYDKYNTCCVLGSGGLSIKLKKMIQYIFDKKRKIRKKSGKYLKLAETVRET